MCQITISGVFGVATPPSDHAHAIHVNGTAEECAQVSVSIGAGGSDPLDGDGPVLAQVGADGTWTAVFQTGVHFEAQAYRCGGHVAVSAVCAGKPDCAAPLWQEQLECNPTPPVVVDCATGWIEQLGPPEACAEGKRRVTFRFGITSGSQGVAASLAFGDGTFSSAIMASSPGQSVSSDTQLPTPVQRDYDAPVAGQPAQFTPEIAFTFPQPATCPVVKLEPPVSIAACPPDATVIPPPDCAGYAITGLTVEAQGCRGTRRSFEATATVAGSAAPTSYQWEWSDYQWEWSDGVEVESTSNTSGHTLDASEDGVGSVAVLVTWPNGCTRIATKPFSVERCVRERPPGPDDEPDDEPDREPGGLPDPDPTNGGIDPPVQTIPDRPTTGSGPPWWCPVLFLGGLILFIAGLALIWGGACSVNIPVVVVGIVLAMAGFALLVSWALLCAGFRGGCRALQRLIELLALLEILLFFLAVIFAILAVFEIGIPCLLGSIIDLAIVGALLAVLTMIFGQIGCQFSRPTLIGRLTGL